MINDVKVSKVQWCVYYFLIRCLICFSQFRVSSHAWVKKLINWLWLTGLSVAPRSPAILSSPQSCSWVYKCCSPPISLDPPSSLWLAKIFRTAELQPADAALTAQRRHASFTDFWDLGTDFKAAIVSDILSKDKSQYCEQLQQALAGATSWTLNNQLQQFLGRHGTQADLWQRANNWVVYQGELFLFILYMNLKGIKQCKHCIRTHKAILTSGFQIGSFKIRI